MAMFAVVGCVYMLESVFFLKLRALVVATPLGERIHIFFVGNVNPR